jgi:hypothetical protein
VRNLVRHKREYPSPRDGSGPDAAGPGPATDDDYELRRARTPVPTFVAEAIETHLSRVYSREVRRSGPEDLIGWWRDVDGCGSSIDRWMAETAAPLLLVLGQLDFYVDHPGLPDGEVVATRADVERLGLNRCIASILLPEDVVWWRLDETGTRYEECLVRERVDASDGAEELYRHWTVTDSRLIDGRGVEVSRVPHPYGRVPIVRMFDNRKARCRNVGQSRYEGVAERQREYYNRDSELILSDTTQAHPLLQGPEDYVQADGTIPIGPSWLLPKKRNSHGGTTTYEGFDVVAFPKEGAESIRLNKADLRDDVDRDSALVRPTGREGVPQSGVAKMIDHADGNNRLARIARTLARAEEQLAELALRVLRDGQTSCGDPVPIEVVYPVEFDLYTAGEVAAATADFQAVADRSGKLPLTEGLLLSRLVRLCLPGLSDSQYRLCDEEIEEYLASRDSRGQGSGLVP